MARCTLALKLGVFVGLILAAAPLTGAQPTEGKGTAPPAPKPPGLRITSVVPMAAGLGFKRAVRIHVDGLAPPTDQADAAKRGAEYQQWVLYLDGRPISRLHPTSVDLYRGDFHFEMK